MAEKGSGVLRDPWTDAELARLRPADSPNGSGGLAPPPPSDAAWQKMARIVEKLNRKLEKNDPGRPIDADAFIEGAFYVAWLQAARAGQGGLVRPDQREDLESWPAYKTAVVGGVAAFEEFRHALREGLAAIDRLSKAVANYPLEPGGHLADLHHQSRLIALLGRVRASERRLAPDLAETLRFPSELLFRLKERDHMDILEDLEVRLDEALPHLQIAVRAVKSLPGRPPGGPLKAVCDALAAYWEEQIGNSPTVSHFADGRVGGLFYEFCDAALDLLPEGGRPARAQLQSVVDSVVKNRGKTRPAREALIPRTT